MTATKKIRAFVADQAEQITSHTWRVPGFGYLDDACSKSEWASGAMITIGAMITDQANSLSRNAKVDQMTLDAAIDIINLVKKEF